MNEPARDLDARASAQEELDAILREAEASRRLAGTNSMFADEPEGPEPPVRVLSDDDPHAVGGVTTHATQPRDTVKFDRYEIKVPEVGESKIKTYKVSSQVPIVIALGVAAGLLWMFAPGGVQLLRARAIPDSYADASARWSLALTMQRIDQFQIDQGRLPQSLDELDPNLGDVMTYQRLADGGIVLQAAGTKSKFSLAAAAPRAAFLAGSTDILRRVPGDAK